MKFVKLYLRDTEEVRGLLSSVWEDTYVDCLTPEAMKKFSENWSKLEELSSEAEESVVVIGAQEGKNIVGIAIFYKTGEVTAEIERLYVLPGYQGRGIGRRLLTEVLVSLEEIETVSLLVEEQNIKTISFYEKFNFQKKRNLP